MKHLSLFTAVALAACSSTDTALYRLPDSAYRLPEGNGTVTALKTVLPKTAAENSLIYQTDAYRVHFSRQNRWAEPLNEALSAALANKLNRRGKNRYIPAHLSGSLKTADTVYIDRFQGSYRGETEISGHIRYADGSRRSFHALTPQYGDGYAAMIESLNRGLDSVAEQLQ